MPDSTNRSHDDHIPPLKRFVLIRLPRDYLVTKSDLEWLDVCSSFLNGEPANETVLAATKTALKQHPHGHIDPFELLIEAGICDIDCNVTL